jgi:hypothetical protein
MYVCGSGFTPGKSADRRDKPRPTASPSGRIPIKRCRIPGRLAGCRGLNVAKINRISFVLLLAGFCAALTLYLTGAPEDLGPLGDPWASKKFVHDMRVIGGKTNAMFAEFGDWFARQWHGQNLGVTLAVLTVLVTLAFRFVAARPDIYRGEK